MASIIYYLFVILIFQLLNINNLPNSYFWETVPDSNTYRLLGETLIECGKLALDCNENSILQWPFGQPLISGILSKYFYNIAQHIYLLIFLASIWFISMLYFMSDLTIHHIILYKLFFLYNLI